jgi:hypothetical protein
MTGSGIERTGRFHVILAVVLSIMMLIAVEVRLFFGVNFSDEAHYIAIPYRFVTGSLPFQDDSTCLLMFSFLSYPFYKLFHLLSNSTDALVIFARQCYLVCAMCAGLLVYGFVRRLLSMPEALLVALLMVAFVPGNIHSLSYNTFTLLLFPLGLLFSAYGVIEGRMTYAGIAGMFMMLVIMAYPPMLMPILAGLALSLWCVRTKWLKFFGYYALGMTVVVAVAMTPFLMHASLEALRENWDFFVNPTGSQGGGLGKLRDMCLAGFMGSYRSIIVGAAAMLLILQYRKNCPKLVLMLPVVPVLMAMMNRYPVYNSFAAHGFALSLALLTPFFIMQAKPEPRRLALLIWIPSVIAALTTGYSSNNGFVNLIIGFFPGVITCMVLVLLAVRNGDAVSGPSLNMRIAFLASIVLVFVYYQYTTVYNDGRLQDLTQQVTVGPYKYLMTAPIKANFAEQITQDVRYLADDEGVASVAFFYEFPAGYLLTTLHPAVNTVWLFYPKTSNTSSVRILERRYSDLRNRPDLLVRMKGFINPDGSMSVLRPFPGYPLEVLITDGSYFPVISRKEYDIFRRGQ